MKNIAIAAVCTGENAALTVQKSTWKYNLWLLFYPVGVVRIWRWHPGSHRARRDSEVEHLHDVRVR